MFDILLVTFPFFALVLAGYAATRRGWLALNAIPGLNAFVLYFALPALLFRFGSTTPIAQLLDAAVFGVYLLAALLLVALVVALSKRRGLGWNDAAFGALVVAFPNTGFMGVPLLAALLGPHSVGTVMVLIVVDMVLTSSLCIALSRLGGQAGGALAAAKQALRGVLANPMPWAIVLGALASAYGLRLPGPLEQTVWLLADAATPVALFTLGAVLARAQLQAAAGQQAQAQQAWGQDLAEPLQLALLKLLLHPLLVWLVGTGAIALGVALDPFALTVMVLVAALPSASNVVLLAERFGADSGRIARIILLSTALSFLSFAAAVAWLGPASP
ncbi:MAG: AEC family transporter [Serpentinimonas sp.]|nr:AEC family transporter [Serpentinimonas sp.]